MLFSQIIFVSAVLLHIADGQSVNNRQKRYLLFTKDTQFGVFATVSIPLPPPNSLVSFAWFFEANYYNVAKASYFEPLLGDIETVSRGREDRSISRSEEFFNRSRVYAFIESMLEKQGFAGRPCLLRAICDNVISHLLHNGLLGDLLHLVLTPSSSQPEEELDDSYYEAEYRGLKEACHPYERECPTSPLNYISLLVEEIL